MEYLPESSSPEVDTFNRASGYSSKTSGFFEPPRKDNSTFYIRSDDTSELYLSLTGNPADKVHSSQLAPVKTVLTKIIRSLKLDPNFC